MKRRFNEFFSNLKIKYKLAISFIILLTLSGILTGLAINFFASNILKQIIKNNLKASNQAMIASIKQISKISLKNSLRYTADKNLSMTAHFYDMYWEGLITEEHALNDTFSILHTESFGKTGFITVTDKDFKILSHPDKKKIGEYFYTTYNFSKEKIKPDKVVFYEFMKPNGVRSQKASYFLFFEPWDFFIISTININDIVSIIDLNELKENIKQLKYGKSGYPFILDYNHNIIAHPYYKNTDQVAQIDIFAKISEAEKAIQTKTMEYTWKNPGENKERNKICYYDYLEEFKWVVISTAYIDDFKSYKFNVFLIIFIVILFSLFFIFPFVVTLSHHLTQPIIDIINKVKQGTEGNYSSRIKRISRDELGELAKYFNYFMRKIEKEIYERLKAENRIIKLNRELEQKVRFRTKELISKNNDLESFAHTVSHDLQSPLGIIQGFVDIIQEDHYDQLDEEAREYLNVIDKTVDRMSELIDDLLSFLKLSSMDLKKETFDLSSIVESIYETYKKAYTNKKISFSIEKNLKAYGDKNLIKIAIENLVSNALKYSSNEKEIFICFGAVKRDDQNMFFISDNGIGFNMEEEEKLFTTFTRLSSSKDFPGNGIGLATVKKIIEKHGGSIYAESELNKGATFFFNF